MAAIVVTMRALILISIFALACSGDKPAARPAKNSKTAAPKTTAPAKLPQIHYYSLGKM